MQENKKRVLTIVGSAIILLLVVIVSYGYVMFTADNTNRQEIGAETATVALIYTDCADSNQEDCANISADLNPGDSISKTFQVENTGTVETIYSIRFSSLINTFVDGELVYTVENIDTGEVLIDEARMPYSETEINNKILLPAMSIGVDEIQRFKMTIKFLNTDYDQSANANATFTIKLGITQKAPMLAANSTWYTQGGTSIARSSITEINIVDSYEPTGTVTDSWDASKDKDGSVTAYVEGTVLTLAGNGLGDIYMNPDSSNVFADINKSDYFNNLTIISGIDLLNSSNVTTFERAFYDCIKLQTLNLNSWDTSNVTNMQYLFNGCSSLTKLNVSNWNTDKVTDMNSMFYNCTSLTELDLTNWNVSKVENMTYMFGAYSEDGTARMSLTTIGDTSKWDTSNVTTMRTMFQNCSSLKEVDVSNWNTENVLDMSYMFNGCSSLATLDVSAWNTEKVTDMSYMFRRCASLTELDLGNFKTTQVTNMSYMFTNMTGLEKVTLGANFSFTGNGSTSSVLPTPASGYWYNSSGTAYTPANVPSLTQDTYYSTIQT